ncbi:hypothetical protein CHCC20333_1044 [Bacillus paralicheniformis]|nr:hypothetical protein CHCC20333_1044 [Bacillus paralicheniformis]
MIRGYMAVLLLKKMVIEKFLEKQSGNEITRSWQSILS